ncbi:MarR family transcriptional regulator [Paenibacillus caseinilyticus]|uniref:HTH marR-type domain-containing protein n=1 Tax=Paenibacillus mucilaginosus K02 TaxID=997761 RepID=I0BFD5_9BACL|nr:MarR family transcriptional regulator [Paenibacillus mucilaginosus]AFH61082.1 hypothetical protein B2K_10160 [Paenibacillus mucilaginosus K02]
MIDHLGEHNRDFLIKSLVEVVQGLQTKLLSEDDEEKEWLIQNSPNPVIAGLIKEMTVMMLHVLDAIGKLEPVNGITISKQFGFSKGSISKITRKLVDKNIIQFEYLPDNKKEVLFRTTPLGKEIYRLHLALHHQLDIGVKHFLQRYNEDELRFLVDALSETLHASWLQPKTDEKSSVPRQSEARTSEEQPHPDKVLGSSTDNEEMNEIMAMLSKLDSSNLKKAKEMLTVAFFKGQRI